MSQLRSGRLRRGEESQCWRRLPVMGIRSAWRRGRQAALALLFCAALPAAAFDVVGKSIADLAEAQSRGRVTSLQLVDAYLERIRRLDRAGPALHSVLALNPQARAQARALDRERAAGRLRGPLHGIPLLIKDNIETADPLPTTAGSLALARNVGGRDAPLVARLRAAGAGICGKGDLRALGKIRSSPSTPRGVTSGGASTATLFSRSEAAWC